jgi:hypothetical protein
VRSEYRQGTSQQNQQRRPRVSGHREKNPITVMTEHRATKKMRLRSVIPRVLFPSETGGDHPSRPIVADRLERPTRRHDEQPYRLLLGFAPDEACHAASVASGPVVSCTTISPLPPRRRYIFCCAFSRVGCIAWRCTFPGRVLPVIVLCGARKFSSWTDMPSPRSPRDLNLS